MTMRKFTSLTAGLAFLLMLLTSIVLCIVPQGRVACWADWRLGGLSKSDWGNIHINLGFSLLLALGLHIYCNWKPITAYLKDRAAVKYGEPPYGHAELSSLKTFTQKLDLDLAASRQLLETAGYAADSSEVTLADLANRYGVPPQRIYQTIQPALRAPAAGGAGVESLPDAPPPGTGSLLLADFCARYHLDLNQVIRGLNAQAIPASAGMALKQIVAAKGIAPTDLCEIIKTLAAAG